MKIKKRKILGILILIIIAFILAIFASLAFNKLQKNKFKKILEENDCLNYELTEIENGEEIKVYVRDKTLLSINGTVNTWVSEFDEKRIIFDTEYKTAILDENDKNLKVNSLNYSYINNFFENSDQEFKFLGKEDGYYKLQFKENKTDKITVLYLNEKNNVIEKMVQNAGNFELVTEFKVEKNQVSKEEIALPNLEGYRATDSVNSNPN